MIRYPTMHVNFLDHRLGKSADAEPVKGEPMPARGIGYGVTEPAFHQGRKDTQLVREVRSGCGLFSLLPYPSRLPPEFSTASDRARCSQLGIRSAKLLSDWGLSGIAAREFRSFTSPRCSLRPPVGRNKK